MLEPCEGKLSCTVLRGESGSNTADLLDQQCEEKRNVFIRRYWYFDSIEDICHSTGFSQSKIKSMLYEMRRKLRAHLENEGIEV